VICLAIPPLRTTGVEGRMVDFIVVERRQQSNSRTRTCTAHLLRTRTLPTYEDTARGTCTISKVIIRHPFYTSWSVRGGLRWIGQSRHCIYFRWKVRTVDSIMTNSTRSVQLNFPPSPRLPQCPPICGDISNLHRINFGECLTRY